MEENGMMCLAHGTIALRKLHSLSCSWEPATACAGCSRASKAAVLWCLPQPCPISSCRETAVPASLFFWREGSSSLASRCLQLQNSWTRGDMPDNLSFFQLYHFASMKDYLFSHLKRKEVWKIMTAWIGGWVWHKLMSMKWWGHFLSSCQPFPAITSYFVTCCPCVVQGLMILRW